MRAHKLGDQDTLAALMEGVQARGSAAGQTQQGVSGLAGLGSTRGFTAQSLPPLQCLGSSCSAFGATVQSAVTIVSMVCTGCCHSAGWSSLAPPPC